MAATAAQLSNILPYFPAKDLSVFHVESLLGGGGFSHVVLARDGAGKEWALKLIPAPGAFSLDDVDRSPLLLTEAQIHLLLSGEPSVLPCLEAFKSVYTDERDAGRHSSSTYMAVLRMPVAACSVEEWLFSASPMPQACQGAAKSQVDEDEALAVWMQMVNAVHRCHAHGIVHKDIKLPNFLMDGRGRVQIMDFGLAQVEGVTPRAVAGTPWTMSPEGLKHGDDGRAGDWWALGVVLYQLLQSGSWPFKHCWWPWQKGGGERMEAAIRRAVLAGRITFQGGGRVGEPLRALIRGLLQPDPNRRWQLRQVLACDAVRPELLARLGQRFPELQPDMEALLQLQRRTREVQAMGSDGGTAVAAAAGAVAAAGAAAAAGLASAGSLLVAKASTVLRGRVSSLVPEGGLHWPHWPGVGGWGEPPGGGGGDDGGSYRPLLDGKERGPGEEGEEEVATTSGAVRAVHSGPSALPVTRLQAEAARRLSWGGTQQSAPAPASPQRHHYQQQPAEGARVADLLHLFPNELPDAHPSPPGTPRASAPPQAADAGPAAAPASGALGLAAAAPGRGADPDPPSKSDLTAVGLTSPVSSAAAGSTGVQHALTTSLTARTGSDITASGHTADAGDGAADGLRSGSHPHTPRRLALTGLQPGSPLRGPIQPGAQPHSPSPRSRRSRTSLHDLFGSLPLQGQLSLHPHPHPRPLSGPNVGRIQMGPAAVEHLSSGHHHHHHHHHHAHHPHPPRGSWPLQRRSGPLLQTLEPGPEDEEAEAGLLPQSSWVPPPPEAFAATRRGEGSGTTRPSPSVRGGAAGAGGAAAGAGGEGGLHGPDGALQPHHRPRPRQHSGLFDQARRLFSACLQRPRVKYDMYDGDEYAKLPAAPAPRKAP